ncbi:MAG: EamA family transporter RarD [Actinobacteria bacterium]|nr:EamA family transporter RarD [Actinomycetota bacterium]NDH13055.1 EamA family transporter RarD [Actinomycetota bacterium]TRZ85489.1 MAG: EamA family transporter RarD [Streptomycetaceae bacterium]
MTRNKAGLLLGLGAYLLWGALPFYWKALNDASPSEILANRGIWSLVICVSALKFRKQLVNGFALLKNRRSAVILLSTSGFLTINWFVYIWSVSVDRVVESALGYYMTPLITVAFGVTFLHEKLRRAQKIAVGLAAVGVVILTVGYGSFPWIALSLAVTWGSYSLLKKTLNAGALEALSVETLFALIPNVGYLIYLESKGSAQFGHSFPNTLLLIGAGFATIAPLLMFNGATLRLPLTTVGLLQYITPTIMFFIGILVNHEDMVATKLFGFVFIWVALIFLGTDLVKSNRSIDNSGA